LWYAARSPVIPCRRARSPSARAHDGPPTLGIGFGRRRHAPASKLRSAPGACSAPGGVERPRPSHGRLRVFRRRAAARAATGDPTPPQGQPEPAPGHHLIHQLSRTFHWPRCRTRCNRANWACCTEFRGRATGPEQAGVRGHADPRPAAMQKVGCARVADRHRSTSRPRVAFRHTRHCTARLLAIVAPDARTVQAHLGWTTAGVVEIIAADPQIISCPHVQSGAQTSGQQMPRLVPSHFAALHDAVAAQRRQATTICGALQPVATNTPGQS
jgi:hypothetical protein